MNEVSVGRQGSNENALFDYSITEVWRHAREVRQIFAGADGVNFRLRAG